jgi:hypothetical protein
LLALEFTLSDIFDRLALRCAFPCPWDCSERAAVALCPGLRLSIEIGWRGVFICKKSAAQNLVFGNILIIL